MLRAIPYLLLMLLYLVPLALLWETAGEVTRALLATAFLVAVFNHSWMVSILEADKSRQQCSGQSLLRDLHYTLFGSIAGSLPYLLMAGLSALLDDSKPVPGLAATLGVVLILVWQLRSNLRLRDMMKGGRAAT